MSAVIRFFQDNAMFYKDMTQWLRNRTFGSLFFGLLFVAEALSLFIIAGSQDITNPGVAMFYTLYSVLIIYAIVIAFMGNGLTSREFVNRTFELFELSGMSLERMIGGKVLSMLYQFFFGFFCLVPFMFFAYFLGGMDFIEMIVGVVAMALAVLPLYLMGLMSALMGRFRQVNVLTRIASGLLLTFLAISGLFSLFSSEPMMREMVRELTDFVKRMFAGDRDSLLFFGIVAFAYVQACLLLFYLCCNSIARETDSRQIPIKVLTTTLVLTWMGLFCVGIAISGYSKGDMLQMTIPVFLVLLGLGLVTYYSPLKIPAIVARRYRDQNPLIRAFYWVFQPGVKGAVRTLLLLLALCLVAGTISQQIAPPTPPAPIPSIASFNTWDIAHLEWWTSASLLIQVPWFLTIPYIFLARLKQFRDNIPAQWALIVACWAVFGVLVFIYSAWVHQTASELTVDKMILSVLLSPVSSMTITDSVYSQAGTVDIVLRFVTGMAGIIIMLAHLFSISREERRAKQIETSETVA